MENEKNKNLLVIALAIVSVFVIISFFFSVSAAANYDIQQDMTDEDDYHNTGDYDELPDNSESEILDILARILILIEQSATQEEDLDEQEEFDFTYILNALTVIIELMKEEDEEQEQPYEYEEIIPIILEEYEEQEEPEQEEPEYEEPEHEEPEYEEPEYEIEETADNGVDIESFETAFQRLEVILVIGLGLAIGAIIGLAFITQWRMGV